MKTWMLFAVTGLWLRGGMVPDTDEFVHQECV